MAVVLTCDARRHAGDRQASSKSMICSLQCCESELCSQSDVGVRLLFFFLSLFCTMFVVSIQ